MATAKQIRNAVLLHANSAIRDYPEDLDMRARVFIARLCGEMGAHGDATIESALERVLGHDDARPSADGA